MPQTIPGVIDMPVFVALYKAGVSQLKICNRFKIGRERVCRLIEELGLNRRRHVDCMTWGPTLRAILSKRYGSKPASALAAEMGVTKNALMGAANRAGLCKPDSAAPSLALTDADFRGCRWIAGNSRDIRPGMFCCAPVAAVGDAWCPEHHAVCYRSAE